MLRIMESLRMAGPSFLVSEPAVAARVRLEGADAERAPAEWERQIRPLLDQLGWGPFSFLHRRTEDGHYLGFTAPLDALRSAAEANEWAISAARASLAGESLPQREEAVERLARALAAERRPALLRLAREARRRGVAFLHDDALVSVGMGSGARGWGVDELPDPAEVDWTRVHDVPAAIVPAGGGGARIARMVASMAEAAGHAVGVSTSEGWTIAGEALPATDPGGPAGARALLRDARVEVAVLVLDVERAISEGVPFTGADVVLLTASVERALPRLGIADAGEAVAAELTLAAALRPGAPVALDADDPALVSGAAALATPIIWYSLEPDQPLIASQLGAGGDVVALYRDALCRSRSGRLVPVVPIAEAAALADTADRKSLSQALAAIAVAGGLGLPHAAIAGGLRGDDAPAAGERSPTPA